MQSNPFHDLYLSEAVSEDTLVEIFSPLIVDLAGAVFETGNVIVRGLQGTGKTMLLNLLRPESRIAYRKARVEFPVPKAKAKFIGAGVNLRKCGALEFAQHLEEGGDERKLKELELLFADFINYWIVLDILATIEKFARTEDAELCEELGLSLESDRLNKFAKAFAQDECWFGASGNVADFSELQSAMSRRISIYRRFLNLNLEALPDEILSSKTLIGDPVLKAAEYLRRFGVLEDSTKLFVRIDQYEQLTTLNVASTTYGDSCQQLIHKAVGARDGRVSYRIGTRSYGWPSRPTIYRTSDLLELKRDFSNLNMDELFRRRENVRTWRFPEFAKDIFARRLRVTGAPIPASSKKGYLNDALKDSEKPQDHANRYARLDSRIELIRREIESLDNIPPEWRAYIEDLGRDDILSAWLACAWVRQRMAQGKKKSSTLGSTPAQDEKPWKPYWHKERVAQALMQIASSNRQALSWSGEDEILNLSGGQILVFLFVMQHIWDAWLRDSRGNGPASLNFPIPHAVQSQGVVEASQEWKNKQIEGPNARQRRVFVESLGRHLYRSLVDDKSMSYPGANGFSIRLDDLDKDPSLSEFLCQSVSYGDLYESSHTSKNPGELRKKYYLAPILSPVFRIPSVHTKEPEYVNIQQVKKWLAGDVTSEVAVAAPLQPLQSDLFSAEK